jgi:UDP-glucuronate decarboxylase
MGKRILVTGGAGFIGQHLCKRLQDEGNTVICLDNYSTGHRGNVHGTAYKQDVTEAHKIRGVLHEIYNLACPASPAAYSKMPRETFLASVEGIQSVSQLARERNAKLLQASTSEVYGDPEKYPQSEDYNGNVNPIGPRSCYDEGKRAAETYLFLTERVNFKIARIFNTYGPGMHRDDGRVVSNFIVQALAGEPLTVYGDGSQTRSFCYVSDTVEGLIRLMEGGDMRRPVNIGNPKEITVKELAEMVKKLTNSSSSIEYSDLPKDDPKRRCPDISRARALFDWEPKVSLEDGLKKTIDYFRGE